VSDRYKEVVTKEEIQQFLMQLQGLPHPDPKEFQKLQHKSLDEFFDKLGKMISSSVMIGRLYWRLYRDIVASDR
jgi:hypothetical protein